MTKTHIQTWLREIPWALHLVLSPTDLKFSSDERALAALRKMNFFLCKRYLRRRFSKSCLEHRFHWIAFFQGTREAGNRHLHVLIYVPTGLRPATPFEEMKLKTMVRGAWLCAREGCGSLFPWVRAIQDGGDSRRVATYVSRYCSMTSWNEQDVRFSH